MISKEKYLSDMKSAKFYLNLAFPYELYNSVNWLYISVICYIVQSDSYTVKWFSLQFSQTVIPLMYVRCEGKSGTQKHYLNYKI